MKSRGWRDLGGPKRDVVEFKLGDPKCNWVGETYFASKKLPLNEKLQTF